MIFAYKIKHLLFKIYSYDNLNSIERKHLLLNVNMNETICKLRLYFILIRLPFIRIRNSKGNNV